MNVHLRYFTIRDKHISCRKAPPVPPLISQGQEIHHEGTWQSGAVWQCKIDKQWMRKNPENYKNKSLNLGTWLPQFSSCRTKILQNAKRKKVQMKQSSREPSGRGSLFGLNGRGLGFRVTMYPKTMSIYVAQIARRGSPAEMTFP